jgi:hypothetical protein
MLRDLGYELGEIERFQQTYLPRIETAHTTAGGLAPEGKDDR